MGQYISNGIVIGIEVYAKKNEKRNIKDLEIIKEHLNKFFCLDYYDIDLEKDETAFYFNIKKEMLEKNIHDCIRDFSRLKKPNLENVFGKKKIDYNSKKFNQENYPLRLEWMEEHSGKRLEIVGKYGELNSSFTYDYPYWLYWDCDLLEFEGKYKVWLTIKVIWYDESKISMEDGTCLLYFMNKMKKEYFKNSLAQNTVFFIDG